MYLEVSEIDSRRPSILDYKNVYIQKKFSEPYHTLLSY